MYITFLVGWKGWLNFIALGRRNSVYGPVRSTTLLCTMLMLLWLFARDAITQVRVVLQIRTCTIIIQCIGADAVIARVRIYLPTTALLAISIIPVHNINDIVIRTCITTAVAAYNN